jgi:hypothetical protein
MAEQVTITCAYCDSTSFVLVITSKRIDTRPANTRLEGTELRCVNHDQHTRRI